MKVVIVFEDIRYLDTFMYKQAANRRISELSKELSYVPAEGFL